MDEDKKSKKISIKTILIFLAFFVVFIATLQHFEPISSKSWFSSLTKTKEIPTPTPEETVQKIFKEESVIIDVVEKSLPSVVTIGITVKSRSPVSLNYDPFDFSNPFKTIPGEEKIIEGNIGSGFIVSEDGIIITNKHVVRETDAQYSVLTNNGKEYDVQKIYRDPLNDLAILKIDANGLSSLSLGDSENLKLGQTAIAIGTPLGEFQNTITTGIVSGLGRGITAGSAYEGFVERLDSVIQTDASISPGNSGGPLLNSNGDVVGVNTAVSSQGENIAFAIPSNVVKELLDGFRSRGNSFERPYIGIRYSMIDKKDAELNDIVEGAYVESVIDSSPADIAGVKTEDIITEIDGEKIDGSDEKSLATLILKKKIGEDANMKVWRNGEVMDFKITLESYKDDLSD